MNKKILYIDEEFKEDNPYLAARLNMAIENYVEYLETERK
jgi:hypothetical protein